MSTITDSKALARHTALRIQSTQGGVCTTSDLSHLICDRFGINPDDSMKFAKALIFIQKKTPAAAEELEAALNALNIGSSLPLALGDRQQILMQKRDAAGHGEFVPETPAKLEALENAGFSIIAASYDAMMELMLHEQFVESIRAMANNNANPANMRRPLNVELTKLTDALD